MPDVPPLAVSTTEAARLLGVSRTCFWQLGRRGLIVPAQLSRGCKRYLVDDLRALLVKTQQPNILDQGLIAK